MKILGNRVLVTRIEEPKKEGFSTVEVQDSFVYKGKVELVGEFHILSSDGMGSQRLTDTIIIGSVILFAKYSPDTQEVDYEGAKAKIIRVEDVLAIL